MTEDEALTLEALKYAASKGYGHIVREMKIAPFTIKGDEALAQPAQEPVAWMRPSEEGYDSAFRDHSTVMGCTGNPWTGWIPLYTTPPQRPWVGLTRSDRKEIERLSVYVEGAIAITEAKLKEKNFD